MGGGRRGGERGRVFFQVVLLLFILMSILSSHGCYMTTHGHPHISSHRPLKTSSHFAVHIHVSPILTRCIVENPRKWSPVFRSRSPSPREVPGSRLYLVVVCMCVCLCVLCVCCVNVV